MKILLSFSFITLYLINSYVDGEKCPENSWRHKHLRLGIFYTKKYYQSWKKTVEKEGAIELQAAIKGIAHRLTQYFSTKHFATASITFDVQENDMRMIDDKDLAKFNFHRRFRMHTTARVFCRFAQKKKEEWKQTWDYAFLLTDAQLEPAYTAGAVANVHSLCSPQSCAVMNFKSAVHGSSAEFLAYPKLLAYFLGLSLGLDQDRRMSIMSARGSGNIRWSAQSRRHLTRYFDDRLEFRCLRWSCGAYDDSGEVFSRPKLVAKLNNICASIFPNMPAKLDRPKTNDEFNSLTRRRSRLREYVSFLVKNRYWYRLENMCKGVPCVLRQRFRRTAFTLYEEDMEGESCGENKECKKGVCVGDSIEKEEEEEEEEEGGVTTVVASKIEAEAPEPETTEAWYSEMKNVT